MMALYGLMSPETRGTRQRSWASSGVRASQRVASAPVGQACWVESAIPRCQREDAPFRSIFWGDNDLCSPPNAHRGGLIYVS
jgi:hypothetical protein